MRLWTYSDYNMINWKAFNSARVWVCVLVSVLLGGCGLNLPLHNHNEKQVKVKHASKEIVDERVYPTDHMPYYDGKYLISPGDQLEVIYHINTTLQEEYLIAIGDQIRVEFYSYPQFDRTLNVRPDGRITLPYAGDLMAAGSTPMMLAKQVDQKYSKLFTRPHSTVSLIRYGERIRELKEAIKTASRGQSRLALVQPDGRISLPLLPPIMAAGHSLDQVSESIHSEYVKLVPGMATSASLHEVTGNKVYVFGAVEKPGFYLMEGPTTMLQAVAMAGGFKNSHQSESSVMITRDEFNRPIGRIVDLKSVLELGDGGLDMFLHQADIVFIPTTRLGRAAIIGDNIRRMIPVNLGVYYNMAESVNFIR